MPLSYQLPAAATSASPTAAGESAAAEPARARRPRRRCNGARRRRGEAVERRCEGQNREGIGADVPAAGVGQLTVETGESPRPLVSGVEDDGVRQVLREEVAPLGEAGAFLLALVDEALEAPGPLEHAVALGRSSRHPVGGA